MRLVALGKMIGTNITPYFSTETQSGDLSNLQKYPRTVETYSMEESRTELENQTGNWKELVNSSDLDSNISGSSLTK